MSWTIQPAGNDWIYGRILTEIMRAISERRQAIGWSQWDWQRYTGPTTSISIGGWPDLDALDGHWIYDKYIIDFREQIELLVPNFRDWRNTKLDGGTISNEPVAWTFENIYDYANQEFGGGTQYKGETESVAETLLNGALSGGETTVTVDSTEEFPGSGTAYINSDEFTYTGKTETTFTGCSGVEAHPDNTPVISPNLGCWIAYLAIKEIINIINALYWIIEQTMSKTAHQGAVRTAGGSTHEDSCSIATAQAQANAPGALSSEVHASCGTVWSIYHYAPGYPWEATKYSRKCNMIQPSNTWFNIDWAYAFLYFEFKSASWTYTPDDVGLRVRNASHHNWDSNGQATWASVDEVSNNKFPSFDYLGGGAGDAGIYLGCDVEFLNANHAIAGMLEPNYFPDDAYPCPDSWNQSLEVAGCSCGANCWEIRDWFFIRPAFQYGVFSGNDPS